MRGQYAWVAETETLVDDAVRRTVEPQWGYIECVLLGSYLCMQRSRSSRDHTRYVLCNFESILSLNLIVHPSLPLQAMVLDTRLNKMQHSAGQLRKLITAYRFWSPNSGHDFRGPQKPYRKL